MPIQESGEMYIETIYLLTKQKERVRSIDVCEHMGYSKPSVSRAVGLLKSRGHIEVSASGYITLTESGKKVAEKILERHETITAFLKKIGVSPETASEDACKIEHVISDESFAKIKDFTSKI